MDNTSNHFTSTNGGPGSVAAAAAAVRNQMQKRLEIEQDSGFKLAYAELKAEQATAAKDIQNMEARVDSIHQEIYQYLSLQAVFLGVVLGAVAQSTSMKCDATWIPLLLSGLVLVAALSGLSMKFRQKATVLRRKRRAEAVELANSRHLNLMLAQGLAYDLHSSPLLVNYNEKLSDQSFWQWCDATFIFASAFLIVVTAVVAASCHYILCTHDNVSDDN